MTAIVPILHPAYILRDRWAFAPAQIKTIARAAHIAEHGWQPRDVREPPHECASVHLDPTLDDLHEWRRGLDSRGCSVDVEAAGKLLRMIGLCRLSGFAYIAVWLWRRDGREPDPEHRKWLAEVLADPEVPLIFHNGQAYDVVKQLEPAGFEVRGFTDGGFDTMLGMHIAYPEMRKGLEPLAKMLLGYESWKWLSGAEAEGEGK